MSDGVTKLSTLDCITICPADTHIERMCLAVPSRRLCMGSITECLTTSAIPNT